MHTSEYILPLADNQATLENVGGKGASLAQMVRAGLPVPHGFHVTTAAYNRFVVENDLQPGILAALAPVDVAQPATLEDASQAIRTLFGAAQTPPDVAGAIALAYAALAGRDPVVAVRSSATAEDLPEASFAGQQDTFLNVDGYSKVLAAVKRCWASLWTARAIGYRARQGVGDEGLSLAVVVQILVPAEAAGILFTANPISGRRDQAMISAAWGLGEAVVGGMVTPDTIIVSKADGQVLEHHVAEKQIMTVRVPTSGGDGGGTEEQPVPAELRQAPVLDHENAAELVRLGVQIEALYGTPMDIEWALADGAFSIVQARPITALPEPTPDVLRFEPPTEWPLPNPKGPYTRGSVTDLMPDPLTPLFATAGLPGLSAAMARTMAEMIGGRTGMVAGMYTTINHYVYQHVELGCRDWLWVLFRMVPAFPRLIRNAERHWRDVARPRYAEVVARWGARPPAELGAGRLLTGAMELTTAMADYLTALQVDTLGTAAGTEGLFTAVYNRFVRREGDPPAATLLLGSDSLPIQAEKSLYDLAQWCRAHPALAAYLLDTPSAQLAAWVVADQTPAGGQVPPGEEWAEWQSRFRAHLARFGHSLYDLDFFKPLPADEPLPLLEALKLYIRGGGTSPYQRQQVLLERREAAVRTALDRLHGLKLRLFRLTLRWAQTFACIREDSIFDIGLGYPALRALLHELGQRLVAAGAVAKPDDVYWLERAELEREAAALDRGAPVADWTGLILERKALWQAEKRATPPQQLPARGRVMGIKMDAFLATSAEEQAGDTLKGVAASPGQVTADARVLHGPEEFALMQPGRVLVAEMTTPAWTPLFAMAAGIVTDVGGPLSHGSIVAREYGIPAVLGTGVATQRIQSGQTVTVDGDAGQVTLK
ncbi:MAG: phosphoenolpyruvate synthase [Anaerolineae bacterium]|nr:phosphoenolpyruvate synthase [Anaerolineae bacterium]